MSMGAGLKAQFENVKGLRGAKAEGQSRSETKSTAFLDGLRGIAALLVLIQHWIASFTYNEHEHGFGENGNYHLASFPLWRVFFSGGSAAVAIFFVLSGYVLSKSSLRMLRTGNTQACLRNLASAIIRRPFRLYVPTLGIMLLTAILPHIPGAYFDNPISGKEATVGDEFLKWATESIKFFNPFRYHDNGLPFYPYNIVVWTIPIELKGSMLVYALLAIQAISGVSASFSVPILALAVAILLQIGHWVMACFLAGLVLADIDNCSLDKVLSHYFTPRGLSNFHYLVFAVGYYLINQPAHNGKPEYSSKSIGWEYLSQLIPSAYDVDDYYRFWHSCGAWMVVYAVLRITRLQRIFSSRLLQYLGRVSFMLYLVHVPVWEVFGSRTARLLGQTFMLSESRWNDRLWIPDIGPAGMSTRFLVAMAFLIPLCMAVSGFFTRYLDEPSVRAAKKLTQALGIDHRTPKSLETPLPLHSRGVDPTTLRRRS